MQHYFLNKSLTTGQSVQLPKEIAHHLGKVLRAEVVTNLNWFQASIKSLKPK